MSSPTAAGGGDSPSAAASPATDRTFLHHTSTPVYSHSPPSSPPPHAHAQPAHAAQPRPFNLDPASGFEPEPRFRRTRTELSYDSLLDDEDEHRRRLEEADEQVSEQHPVLRFNPSGTSTLGTVFLMVNAALGAGLLNFPKSFDDAGGIAVAVSVQLGLLVFIVAALAILAHCSDESNASTLQEAMEGTTGAWGRRVTAACVAVYCFGTTVTFLIIIGDQFDRAFASMYGADFCHVWYMSRTFTMSASSVLFVLPLCYSKKIDFLRVPSTLGVIAVLYIVGLILAEYFFGGYQPGPVKRGPTAWTDLFLVVPDITFGYQCHISAIPIYSCMKRRSPNRFSLAASAAVLVCALCYTVAAAFGYLTFGSVVNNDILESYSGEKRPEVLVAVIAMALKTMTTYPILLFCGREAALTLVQGSGLSGAAAAAASINSSARNTTDLTFYSQSSRATAGQTSSRAAAAGPSAGAAAVSAMVMSRSQDSTVTAAKNDDDDDDARPSLSSPEPGYVADKDLKERALRATIVTAWFVSSLALAVFIPNIGTVIKLLGSLAAVFIFVFPGVCLLQTAVRADPSLVRADTIAKIVFAAAFVAIGAFTFGVVITQGIQYALWPPSTAADVPICR